MLLTSCLTILIASPAIPYPAAGDHQGTTLKPAETTEAAQPRDDVIARVGDQPITFGEINILLNSSAIVGVSIPAVGTRERDRALILLLDRFISAKLVYLDALKQGLDEDPVYRRDLQRIENAMLADLYRRQEMIGAISVSEQEIRDYFEKNGKPGSELAPDICATIELTLRRQKMNQRLADASKHIRDGVQVVVNEENLSSEGDASPHTGGFPARPVAFGCLRRRLPDPGDHGGGRSRSTRYAGRSAGSRRAPKRGVQVGPCRRGDQHPLHEGG